MLLTRALSGSQKMRNLNISHRVKAGILTNAQDEMVYGGFVFRTRNRLFLGTNQRFAS